MSSLPSSHWPPPFTPPSGDPIQPLAAAIPPPSTTNSVSPSLLIIGVIILFVILASISIHLLLRLLSSRSAPSASSRVFSTSSLSSSSDGPLHFTPQPETNQESSNNNKTDALIEALPLFTLASSLAGLPKSSPDCAVCLCPFDPTAELRLLPACRHAFHSQCIDTWLRSTPSCPLCRASVRLPFPPLPSAGGGGHGRTDSFRVEIGSISRRRSDDNPNSASGRSYSIGSFDYRIEDEIEAVVSRIALLKEEKEGETTIVGAPPPPGEHVAEVAGGEARGWLRDYVDRLTSSASSSFNSLRFSGRWSARSSHRPENAATAGADSRRWDVEAASLAVEGEEEAFYAVYRWIAGV